MFTAVDIRRVSYEITTNGNLPGSYQNRAELREGAEVASARKKMDKSLNENSFVHMRFRVEFEQEG